MELNGKEIPARISIKTSNYLKLFLIEHNLLKLDVERGITEL